MAQLVEHLALGFGAGHDLLGWRDRALCIRLCASSMEPAWDSLSLSSLSLSLSHLSSLSLSLSLKINKLIFLFKNGVELAPGGRRMSPSPAAVSVGC